MIAKILVTLGVIIIALVIIVVVGILIITDDVEKIDNSDSHIICGDTGEPCIRDTLFTKCDNCSDCPLFKN